MWTIIHISILVSLTCMCMNMWSLFFWNKDSNILWSKAHWLKVESKQSILFFKTQISFLSIFEKATLVWETKSFSIEINPELFFKESFSFKTKLDFEDKAQFFSLVSNSSFLSNHIFLKSSSQLKARSLYDNFSFFLKSDSEFT